MSGTFPKWDRFYWSSLIKLNQKDSGQVDHFYLLSLLNMLKIIDFGSDFDVKEIKKKYFMKKMNLFLPQNISALQTGRDYNLQGTAQWRLSSSHW